MSMTRQSGGTAIAYFLLVVGAFELFARRVHGFRPFVSTVSHTSSSLLSAPSSSSIPFSRAPPNNSTRSGDHVVRRASPEKALAFLKKIGKGPGGWSSGNVMGIDEGSEASSSCRSLQKVSDAFFACTDGIIDDLSEAFPVTRCGTRWGTFTDQVMGGISEGSLTREVVHGRAANVLRGTVCLENNGGFIQMATNLAAASRVPSSSEFRSSSAVPVDASQFEGVELDVISLSTVSESFNVHLKTTACTRPQMSYRATFEAPSASGLDDGWSTVRIPFSQFVGHRVEGDPPLNTAALTRMGIVAIGRAMNHVELAVAGVRFYGGKRH